MHIYLALLPIPFSSETTWTFTFLYTRFIGNTSSAVVVVSRTQACSETRMRLSLASWFLLSGPLGWKCVPNKYFGLYWLKLWPLLPHSQTLHFLPQCCLRLSQIWTTNVGWARKKKNKEAFKNKNIIFSQTLLLSSLFKPFIVFSNTKCWQMHARERPEFLKWVIFVRWALSVFAQIFKGQGRWSWS